MESTMEKKERTLVEKELNSLMMVTLKLEAELEEAVQQVS